MGLSNYHLSYIDHLNSAISSARWTSSFYSSFLSLSSYSILSNREVCLELMSSLMIWTFEKYSLFLSSLLSSSSFLAASYFFFFSMSSCLFLNYSCFLVISACLYVTYLANEISSSILAFSTDWISFSRLSIST